jgi:predicted MFS family arabinose efflux permease
MATYNPADWGSFLVAMVSAAAALTGLLFVAVSINLQNIVKGAWLTSRAAETLACLLLVVLSCAFALMPQSVRLIGAEILILALPMLVITVRLQVRHRRANPDQPLLWSASRMASSAAGTVTGSIAGLSLIAEWGGGLYWLAAAALLGIVGAVYNAWVLLVEIIR